MAIGIWERIVGKTKKPPSAAKTYSLDENTGSGQSHAPMKATPAPTLRAASIPALAGVRNVIAVASGKGGVGKSTVTTNLAVALARAGKQVGLLDADIYGPSQPGMLGSSESPKTDQEGHLLPVEKHGVKHISLGLLSQSDAPVIWRAPMATKLVQQFLGQVRWNTLDHLLIDLPPGTGDIQLTLAQQAQLSGAIIVTTPQEVALGIAKKGLQMFRQLNVPILGIVENMSGFECSHCHQTTAVFKEGGGARLAKELGVPFLGAIPLDPAVMMSGDDGVPVLERASDTKAAHAFLHLAFTVEDRLSQLKKTSLEPEEISLSLLGELLVRWPDGERGVFTPYTMRVNCGCASCVDENTGTRLLDPASVSDEIRFLSVQPVGRYAVTAQFSDGHSTGIYPFTKLREMQPATPVAGAPKQTAPAAPTEHVHGPGCSHSHSHSHAGDDVAAGVRELLKTQVNPGLASHGGQAELVELKGSTAYVRMSGGCQGCGAAKQTLKGGIEKAIRAQFPQITEVIDLTDHTAGTNPYYK
jgi:ATP-binding protein involved in chromosome partitioning